MKISIVQTSLIIGTIWALTKNRFPGSTSEHSEQVGLGWGLGGGTFAKHQGEFRKLTQTISNELWMLKYYGLINNTNEIVFFLWVYNVAGEEG